MENTKNVYLFFEFSVLCVLCVFSGKKKHSELKRVLCIFLLFEKIFFFSKTINNHVKIIFLDNCFHFRYFSENHHTLCEVMSSMNLAITDEAIIILGSLITQSKASFVTISPIPMKLNVVSKE